MLWTEVPLLGARRVFYLETLRRQLPRITEGGSLASVLEHCMYCGMSLGRVGLDFRGLLVPIFEAEVLRLVANSVKAWPINLHLSILCAVHLATMIGGPGTDNCILQPSCMGDRDVR
jgi:hypothetical protein